MNRRHFLKTTLAAGTAVVATKLFGFTKYLDPSKHHDIPITTVLNKPDLDKGISEFGIFNSEGTLLSRHTFTPIYVKSGDTVEFKYILKVAGRREK